MRGELSGQVGADAIRYTMLLFSIICSPFPCNGIAHLHLPQCYCNFLWEEHASLPIDIRLMPTHCQGMWPIPVPGRSPTCVCLLFPSPPSPRQPSPNGLSFQPVVMNGKGMDRQQKISGCQKLERGWREGFLRE